jgi:effector-binding domain-containing protein
MPYQVQLKQVEPLPTAVVRRRASVQQLSSVVPQGCGVVWDFVRSCNIPHSGINMALYWDGEINLECGVVVLRPFPSAGPVICSETPAGMVATTVHIGPYNRLGEAHQAICEYCSAEGFQRAGPNWEIYDHWTDDPAKLHTDVFYLLTGGDRSGASG